MWLHYVDNPLAITQLYKDVPPLENMEVFSRVWLSGCAAEVVTRRWADSDGFA